MFFHCFKMAFIGNTEFKCRKKKKSTLGTVLSKGCGPRCWLSWAQLSVSDSIRSTVESCESFSEHNVGRTEADSAEL